MTRTISFGARSFVSGSVASLSSLMKSSLWHRRPAFQVAAHSGGIIAPGLILDLGRRRSALPMSLTPEQIIAATPADLAAAMRACALTDVVDFARPTPTTVTRDGLIRTVAANQLAFDDRGLALFEGRTNFVRRSSHTEAYPWIGSTHNGITATMIATGLVGDVPYADFALTGTNTTTWTEPFADSGYSMTSDCSVGDDFTSSLFVQDVSGGWPAVSVTVGVHEDSGTGWLAGNSGGGPLAAAPQRIVCHRKLSEPTMQIVRSAIILDNLGSAGDTTFTGQVIRFYGWQMERSPFASPLIQTLNGDIATRAADSCKLTPRARALLRRAGYGLIVQAGPIEGGTWGRLVGGSIPYPADVFAGISASDPTAFFAGGATAVSGSGGRNAPFGLAAGYDTSGIALAVNEGAATSSPGNALDASAEIRLGRDAGGEYANGYYQGLVLYPARPANEALSAKAVPHV